MTARGPPFCGLTLETARDCLNGSPKGELGGLIVSVVNPGNDPDGLLNKTLVAVVAEALAAEPPTAAAPTADQPPRGRTAGLAAARSDGRYGAARSDGRFGRCALGRGTWRAR